MEAKTERSELTQTAIVDMALEMAAREGLESLSIGEVAKRLNLSKSGVFSRIGSREALQRAVLEEFDRRFQQDILLPALREPRGLPRLDAIMAAWLQRATTPGLRGACLYAAGSFEFDDCDENPCASCCWRACGAGARCCAAACSRPWRPAICVPTSTPTSWSSSWTASSPPWSASRAFCANPAHGSAAGPGTSA